MLFSILTKNSCVSFVHYYPFVGVVGLQYIVYRRQYKVVFLYSKYRHTDEFLNQLQVMSSSAE